MSGDDQETAYQRLRNLIDFSLDVICAIDKNGCFIEVSNGCTTAWGYAPHEIIGKTVWDFLVAEDERASREAIDEMLTRLEISHFENHYYHRDGSVIPLEWTAKWDAKQEIAYCVARNASQKKDAEIKLEQSEKRFRALVQHSYEMITVIDLEGNYQYNSDSVYRILGYTSGQLIGKNALTLVHPEDLPNVSKALNRLYTDPFIDDLPPFRFRNNQGDWIWVEVTGTNLMNDPAVRGAVINARDVTEKIKLQKKLSKAEATYQRKITAAAIEAQERERSQLGIELHDHVNQVLSTIKLYIEMYLTGLMHDNKLLEKATTYTQDCINEIRSISARLSAPTLGSLSLNESVTELIASLNAPGTIYIELGIADFSVSAELHLALYRIIQEQLNNVIRHSGANKVWVSIIDSYKVIRLLIKDNGIGFDPQVQKKGIGLMSIASRVETLKGQFSIKSSKGKGCELKVIIPNRQKRGRRGAG